MIFNDQDNSSIKFISGPLTVNVVHNHNWEEQDSVCFLFYTKIYKMFS